jgi:predicted DNA-binding transcriptional regulator AlpA
MSLAPVPSLDELAVQPERAQDLPPEVARDLLIRLAPLQEVLRLQALVHQGENGQPQAPAADRLLTVAEAAQKLGLSRDYLYRHAKTFPFTVRIPPRQLRFSLRGIERWIHQRQGR